MAQCLVPQIMRVRVRVCTMYWNLVVSDGLDILPHAACTLGPVCSQCLKQSPAPNAASWVLSNLRTLAVNHGFWISYTFHIFLMPKTLTRN